MFLRNIVMTSKDSYSEQIKKLKREIENSDAILIGAGAGLSASAGFVYTGERFNKYFFDFHSKYKFNDMYSGGFYPYKTLEEMWSYWSRYIYINRYTSIPKSTYSDIISFVKNKDYFVITTNVDHCFQKAGVDKHKLFYTQGDYGLLQCSEPCHKKTYDNEKIIKEMVIAQGFKIKENGELYLSENIIPKMAVPTELIPMCPVCGKPMSMNLRSDDTFVEDEGWHKSALRYDDFVRRHKNLKVLYLELGVGANTPVIIKYPFWQMTVKNPKSRYICINFGESFCPKEIENQSLCINSDISTVIEDLKKEYE